MVNLENKLTVDDLIIEYMNAKIEILREPSFFINEFMTFLSYIQDDIKVEDVINDGEKLFKRFFERKNKKDWGSNPNMTMEYNEEKKDYCIKANFKFGCYDMSIINTYFMDKSEVSKIRSTIESYLSQQPKRIIKDVDVENYCMEVGKFFASCIIKNIWSGYVKEKIEKHNWPIQCENIDEYLLKCDLATVIGLKSIRKDLLEFYRVVSKRIAILFAEDKKLKISSDKENLLFNANYRVLVDGYEELMAFGFGEYKSSLVIDTEKMLFTESHEVSGVYDWDEDADIVFSETRPDSKNIKRLVKSLETYSKGI